MNWIGCLGKINLGNPVSWWGSKIFCDNVRAERKGLFFVLFFPRIFNG